MVFGSDYQQITYPVERQGYWNAKYRLEAITELEEMLADKMNDETFAKVKQPSLTLYYYKNEKEQDPTVRVSAMLEMNKALGTADSLKVEAAIPEAGAHVIGCSMTSHAVPEVIKYAEEFAERKLGMKRRQ